MISAAYVARMRASRREGINIELFRKDTVCLRNYETNFKK